MFEKAIHNVKGAVTFNPAKFPILIGLGDDLEATMLCLTPDDIPQETDFIILETCIDVIAQKGQAND